MQILFFDDDPAIDQSILRHLQARSYELTVTRTAGEVMDLIQRIEFDCILLDVSATAECMGLLEIRQLVRTSAVGFMTRLPIESLVQEAIAEGSIEFQPLRVLIENLGRLHQPIMLAGPILPPSLFRAARDKGLRISTAKTLQFAMNLLVDGWCQIVWVHSAVPGWVQPAIVHHVGAKPLAILASGLSGSTPGITCSRKPEKAAEFVAVLQRIAGNQAASCGLVEVRGRRDLG